MTPDETSGDFSLLLYTDRNILEKCLKVHVTPKNIIIGINYMYFVEQNTATSCVVVKTAIFHELLSRDYLAHDRGQRRLGLVTSVLN